MPVRPDAITTVGLQKYKFQSGDNRQLLSRFAPCLLCVMFAECFSFILPRIRSMIPFDDIFTSDWKKNSLVTTPESLNHDGTDKRLHHNRTNKRLHYNSKYMQLPTTNHSASPVSFGACCGLGHRLTRNVPTMVYAISQSRPLYAHWTDIPWGVLFNDTDNIKAGQLVDENYDNSFPHDWWNYSFAWYERKVRPNGGTSYDRYGEEQKELFDMLLAQSIVKSLEENLTPLVLSFLDPIREQTFDSELHLCTHVREGNNETGDWLHKTWRHIDLIPTLNATLLSMQSLAAQNGAKKVSIFVASDNKKARSWFVQNVTTDWNVIQPVKELPRPESGVWFGEHGSKTNQKLGQYEKHEAMAEAVADVFALGKCDALYIPNYSSFSMIGIIMMRAEWRKVFFMDKDFQYQYWQYSAQH